MNPRASAASLQARLGPTRDQTLQTIAKILTHPIRNRLWGLNKHGFQNMHGFFGKCGGPGRIIRFQQPIAEIIG